MRRILVGTDRSETSQRALRFASEMAKRYEAELLVLQVLREGSLREAESEFGPYLEKLGVAPVRALVRSGSDPASEIVAAVREEEIDVVVLGSVGMAGRKEFLLDNVPNRVSHNAPCTVVIVQTDQSRS